MPATARALGYSDYMLGKSMSDNRFKASSPAYKMWEQGWIDAVRADKTITDNERATLLGEETSTAETKAFCLHAALSSLLEYHKHLIRDTNSEPTFGEPEEVTAAERALFENRPLADWEPNKRRLTSA
jgi:hypothetical protein